MAGNYWVSTQREYWLFTKDTLYEIRDEIEKASAKAIKQHPLFDRRLVLIYVQERLRQLAKRLQFRQQCVATALVYIQRYLLSTPLQNVNIYLLVATAFYLSSKTEESPHHIRLVATEARNAWPEYISGDISRIGEMEFSLISEMRSQLIIWHPYRSLSALKDDNELNMTPEEFGVAWSIINDSYLTDLPLICHPHIIATVAVFMAILFAPSRQSSSMQPLLAAMVSRAEAMANRAEGGENYGSATQMASFRGGISHAVSSQMPPYLASQAVAASNGSKSDGRPEGVSPEKFDRAFQFLSVMVEDNIDNIQKMIEAVQEIIGLYDIWEQYSDKNIRDAIACCNKGRSLES